MAMDNVTYRKSKNKVRYSLCSNWRYRHFICTDRHLVQNNMLYKNFNKKYALVKFEQSKNYQEWNFWCCKHLQRFGCGPLQFEPQYCTWFPKHYKIDPWAQSYGVLNTQTPPPKKYKKNHVYKECSISYLLIIFTSV